MTIKVRIIRILSVASRARIAYDFWVKVSKFLRRRGSEYRSRCIHRDVVNIKGGSLHVPASFPHKAYIPLTIHDPNDGDDPEWEEPNVNELHEAVVLEKYIPLTKSLYNSILADMDAVLPIILNPDEKAIVRHQGTSVVIGRSGTGKTTALVYKMRANAQVAEVSDDAEPLRQLFVTRSPVLTRRVASYYSALIESGEIANKTLDELRIIRQVNQEYQPRDLLEFDNEADLRDDLPDRYTQNMLLDFFTIKHKLGQLLEADALGTDDPLALARVRLKRPIDFKLFKHQYWPKFDYNLTRVLDPALVFSEIMGVIKGYGHDLTEDEYIDRLSNKKSPLLAGVRSQVYAIFKAYKKRCMLRGETDSADRVRTIISARKDVVNTGGMDYLFVDEVQDQLMAEIYLLHSLCPNLDGGYWCGDTAQTINVGSSFRIRDLKSYLYEKMVPHTNTVLKSFQHKIAAPFSTFELTVNFRSHNGIVKYAASLVQLIYTLFPGSIDHMQPESAPVPGPKPLIFVSPSEDEDFFAECLFNRKLVGEVPPFGPEQAIIVRSEETAHSLRKRLQNRCNVLTLFESKGLEFDDLILYGFFTESDISASAWRRVAILESYEDDGAIRFTGPQDTEAITPGVCSELKQLYVAVTRARHRCWLWDSGSITEMMMSFWQSLGLIKVADSVEDLCLFAESSGDPRQWAQRGEAFFSNGLYAIATTCFERAGREKEAQIADAYNHMVEAGKLQEDNLVYKSAHIAAAQKMVTCTKLNSTHSTATLWYHAATCFEAAKQINEASAAYLEGKFYDRAVLVFFEAQDMPGCLEVIQSYSKHIDQGLLRRIKEVASVHFLRQQDYRRLQLLYEGDLGECIRLAQSLRFKTQLKDLLRLGHHFEDLATEYLSDGLAVDAVNCLIHYSRTPSAIQFSRRIISTFMWTNFGLNTTCDNATRNQASLLMKISNSQEGLLDSEGLQDSKIFEIIIAGESIPPILFYDIIGRLNHRSESYIYRTAILRYFVLKGNGWISCRFDQFLDYLAIWSTYQADLQIMRALKCPSQVPGIRRLFGLSGHSTTDTSTLIIPSCSQLHYSFNKSRGKNKPHDKNVQSGIRVHSLDADAHIQAFFTTYARKELISFSSDLLESCQAQVPRMTLWKSEEEASILPENAIKSISLILSTLNSAMDPAHGGGPGSVLTRNDEEKIRIAWSMRTFSVVFLSNGMVGGSQRIRSRNVTSDSGTSARSWIERTLELLDPLEHERKFATLFIACVCVLFELWSASACPKTFSPLMVKKTGRFPTPQGCPKEPGRFSDDIVSFFQRRSEWRIINMDKTLKRMIQESWFIDVSILIQLIEQTTREVILSERATAPWSSGGFSGLIAPCSWVTNLAMHSIHAEHAYALKPRSLCEFVGRVGQISDRITNGIPKRWTLPITCNGGYQPHPGAIVVRLFWSIVFVMVNLHSSHQSIGSIQEVLVQSIIRIIKFETSLKQGFETLGFSISCLPEIANRSTILANLCRIYRPEEVLMLRERGSSIDPDSLLFPGRTIEFNTLTELRNILVNKGDLELEQSNQHQASESMSKETDMMGMHKPQESETNAVDQHSTTISPGGLVESEEFEPEPPGTSQTDSVTLRTRPDTPASIADANAEEVSSGHIIEPKISPEGAALLVYRAWRRSVDREEQRRRLSDFDQAGQLYEQYRPYFPKCGPKAPKRDKVGLRLIRGPCIDVIVGLRALVEEIDTYSEALNEEIQAPGLTPAQVASTQESIKERRKKAESYKERVLSCCPSDAPAKLLIAKNLAGVKTQTTQAWDAFMLVKNSGILQKSEEFKRIDVLVSGGRGAVLNATKRS
ncbi:hypothetical protein RhiTH_005946 [Rhizoctonia solani]